MSAVAGETAAADGAAGPAPVRVALLGAGTVGAAVVRGLYARADLYAERVGAPVELVGIAVRDTARERDLPEPAKALVSGDPEALVARDDVDVVVELMGGVDGTRPLLEAALRRGRPVVSANKQLIAQHGPELHALADEHGAPLLYEAAVMGAIPVLHVVGEALSGDRVTSIHGIMNGSTNYILDLVARLGVPFEKAVAQAGELGYLEADPTEDLEGLDAAAKIVILARCAWGVPVRMEDVQREGISGLTDADFEAARGGGQVIKLIASAWRSGPSRVEVAVRPVNLAADHPFAQTREGGNAVIIEAESAGTLRLHGAGAGGDETASAVLGDIVSAARAVRHHR